MLRHACGGFDGGSGGGMADDGGALWAQIARQVPWDADRSRLPAGVEPGMIRYVSQPNGWGRTKEEALKDLQTRIYPWYERNFGDRPGFEIERGRETYVEFTPGRLWQADGRVVWYAKPVPPRRPNRPAMGRFNYGN